MNRYLKMDPDTITRLSRLKDRAIKLEITDWRLHFFMVPHDHGMELLPSYSGEVTTTIRANLFDLIKILHARGDTKALFKNQLDIEGDTTTGEAIQKILANIDIDWEEQLSKVTGDVVAHRIGETTRGLRDFSKSTLRTFSENLKSFLQLESNQLPSRHEVEQFIQDVTKLQQDVERLEARMDRLTCDV